MSLSDDEVVNKLKGARLGKIHQHAVQVGGGWYPVKEAFAQVTGRDLLDFTTMQARSVFQRLGFPLQHIK